MTVDGADRRLRRARQLTLASLADRRLARAVVGSERPAGAFVAARSYDGESRTVSSLTRA